MSNSQPDGFLARPAEGDALNNAHGDAVLVLHAWWGLNDALKTFCTRLATEGLVAFAPDLYHGQLADTIEGAQALSSALDEERAHSDIAAAMRFLREQDGVSTKGLAVIGFSLGAYFALQTSIDAPDAFRSVVVFYGTGPRDFSGAQAAYLGHFAENDPFEPRAEVDVLEAALREANREVTFHFYEGTGHWFFEPDRGDAFDEAAASLAWRRTLAFLRRL